MATKPKTKINYIAEARKRLDRIVVEVPQRKYFDLGNEALNAMLGKPGRGIFAGEIIELRGEPSAGKSALAGVLESIMVASGGVAHHVDLENSWDDEWMATRGISREDINLIQPYVTLQKQEKAESRKALIRQLKAQDPEVYAHMTVPNGAEILEEAETCLALAYAEDPQRFQLLVVDSVAALLPGEQLEIGLDQNMRSKMSLAVLLGDVLKQWTAKLMLYNTALVLINQLRINPMQHFGDNRVSPGGRSIEFFSHVRVGLTRTGKAREVKGYKVGIDGKARVTKNKAGGPEGALYEFFLPFSDDPYDINAA
jgi:RecA/RadA recombinase